MDGNVRYVWLFLLVRQRSLDFREDDTSYRRFVVVSLGRRGIYKVNDGCIPSLCLVLLTSAGFGPVLSQPAKI